ncbi:MAG: YcjF family protein [Cetobacterium sp.]
MTSYNIEKKDQILQLEEKKDEAEKIIRNYTIAATGVGAIPIPFADAPILISGQIKMIHEIFEVYGIQHSLSKEVLLTVIIQKIISQGAKFLVKYLLRKINFLTGVIVGGGMAGAITYSLGRSVSEIAYSLKESSINDGELAKNADKINELIEKAIENSFKGLENLSAEVLDKILSKNKIRVR